MPTRAEWDEKRRERFARGIGQAATKDETVKCPTCDGAWLRGHPDSVIAFDHTADCLTRTRMDGQYIADIGTAHVRNGFYIRYANETELMLLEVVGETIPEPVIAIMTDAGVYRYETKVNT